MFFKVFRYSLFYRVVEEPAHMNTSHVQLDHHGDTHVHTLFQETLGVHCSLILPPRISVILCRFINENSNQFLYIVDVCN